LKKADFDAVYVSSKVMSQKGNDSLNDQFIQNCFGDNSLPIIHKTEELETFMNSYIQNKTVVLLMSSGNFDGFDFKNYTASLP
jgi:UDP-N-acetylmuramate: L-alanyl-gamma-D-glutamyl-meso-diaminopimelate ligase